LGNLVNLELKKRIIKFNLLWLMTEW